MSHYKLPGRLDHPEVTHAAIGWDRPLQTYFAQVFSESDTEDEPEAVIWRGTYPDELATPAAAIAIIMPYAIVPAGLAERLAADRRVSEGKPDGPLQRRARLGLFRPDRRLGERS